MDTDTSGLHRSYWVDSAGPKPNTPTLCTDLTVDTCIIGAGITGLTAAYFLVKQGQTVAVLEDGDVASGETGRTTGYLTWVIDDGLHNIIKYYGKEGAILHVESHKDAVDTIENIVKDEGIDCEFRRVPNYWFSRKPKSEQSGQPDSDLTKELEAMKEVGIHAEIVDSLPWAADDGKCLKIGNQGQFHSVKYLYQLTDRIMNAGGQVYTKTKVVDWKGGAEPYVKTQAGNTVKCKSLLMATNAPFHFLTTIAKLESQRSYVVAGEVPKGKYEWFIFQDDSMIHRKPYNYGRFTSSDASTDLILIGGKDHLVGFKKDYDERYQALEQWAKERFPDIKFTYRWSGQVEEPVDFLAYSGKDPQAENVYLHTGDSGMGLTHGTLGAKLISDLILGKPNPYIDLYDPKRLKVKAVPELVKHVGEINTAYADYLKGGDVADIEDIVPGEGAIICKGLKYYAVYKDEEGKAHACSAVCPHMKARVRWNNSEKSWDCPAHGSRFDKYGTTINAPAKSDLEKVDLAELSAK